MSWPAESRDSLAGGDGSVTVLASTRTWGRGGRPSGKLPRTFLAAPCRILVTSRSSACAARQGQTALTPWQQLPAMTNSEGVQGYQRAAQAQACTRFRQVQQLAQMRGSLTVRHAAVS